MYNYIVNKFKGTLASAIKTNTFRQSGITFIGTFVTGILGMAFFILLPRNIGAEAFGIFSISIAVSTLIADIGDVGTDTGLVQFVGRYIGKDKDKAYRFMKLGLKVKFVVWLAILILGWILTPYIASELLHKPEVTFALRISLFGAGTALLYSFSTHALQSLQKFWVWSGLNISLNAIRLLGLILLVVAGGITINSSLFLYILIPLLGFAIGFFFLPKFWKVKDEGSVSKQFFHYNKWVAAFTVVSAISARLDTLLTARHMTLADVGVYSVAVSLASVVPQFVAALGTVVAPKLASMEGQTKKAKSYFIKIQSLTLGLVAIGVPVGILLSYFFIPLFYGEEFRMSIYPLAVLLVAHSIFLLSVPAHTSVMYYFSYPKLFFYLSFVYLFIVAVIGNYLISNYGYMGASYSVLIASSVNFIIPLVWVTRKFNKS